MTTHRDEVVPDAATVSGYSDADRQQAYSDYVHDQLQLTRMTTDHAAVLQQRAPARIAEARAAIAKAPGREGVTASLDRYHAVERMLDEKAFYPPHDKRKESPAYAAMHHQMTVVDDKHCLVCGVQHSTLDKVEINSFGAVQMETHHHTIEWALANAIDPVKFNAHIRPGLKRAAEQRKTEARYANLDKLYKIFDAAYESDMDEKTIRDWVDHAADNLWVLCDVHHRHKFVGIHSITYPIWGPQDIVNPTVVAEEIKLAKDAKLDHDQRG